MTKLLLILSLMAAVPKTETVTIATSYQLRGPAKVLWVQAVASHKDGGVCQVMFLPLRWDRDTGMKPIYLSVNPGEKRDLDHDYVGHWIGNEIKDGESFAISTGPPQDRCAVVKIYVERPGK